MSKKDTPISKMVSGDDDVSGQDKCESERYELNRKNQGTKGRQCINNDEKYRKIKRNQNEQGGVNHQRNLVIEQSLHATQLSANLSSMKCVPDFHPSEATWTTELKFWNC